VQYTGKNISLTFDTVDSIMNTAFVYPNKILEKNFYIKQPKAHSEVVFTLLPIHFFQRDNWTMMDTKELRIQRSPYDLATDSKDKADLLLHLMYEHEKANNRPEQEEGTKKRKNTTTTDKKKEDKQKRSKKK